MFIFSVKSMRVESQAAALRQAVHHVDPNAAVHIDLLAHEIQVTPTTAGATELSDAIAGIGFDADLKDCGDPGEGVRRTPSKIPFEGFDHDFSASLPADERVHVAIAGVSKKNSVLPAGGLGPLSDEGSQSGREGSFTPGTSRPRSGPSSRC